ncbi:syntenin-1-like [Paramacrobiotus metropolitanus]|uniref:syntenin-1-like n=1 Tax=Paramacrobiotus metropolitanus TaxID=2943436 RepID=UPI002445C4F9|nr:syntenin-1-like [Paramacrobiotus metropolitanus]XP_055337595.1 syntenin-1-like [Paramacrobiotus metropolitanus]
MSLYPTLEDMHVGGLMEAQKAHDRAQALAQQSATPPYNPAAAGFAPSPGAFTGGMYPSLNEYMGLSPEMIDQASRLQTQQPAPVASQAVVSRPAAGPLMSGPVTGGSVGLLRAQVTHGIRAVTLCKDGKGKAGLRLYSVNNGVFISFVMANSPAALCGLRFGDQILQMNDENCAGWSTDHATKKLQKAAGDSIRLAVRDRPFERTITMVKDSANRVGFGFRDGRIEKIVRESSAARNGILTDHNLLEVNGQNVIGLKDKEILQLLEQSPNDVTITIMPSVIFQHIMKNMSGDLVRKSMDHSVPCI